MRSGGEHLGVAVVAGEASTGQSMHVPCISAVDADAGSGAGAGCTWKRRRAQAMQSSKEWQRLSTSSCTTCSSCSLADASDAWAEPGCQLRYSPVPGALCARCTLVLPMLRMHSLRPGL